MMSIESMSSIDRLLAEGKKNFVFLGEAGSGKSEIAVNFAEYLRECGKEQVHFFDMDMTKPLFRSRDLKNRLEEEHLMFHYEEQFMDAPTLVGGTREFLKNPNCFVVMDVGGDDIGARAIGGVMAGTDRKNTVIYYVLNAFRPWSDGIDHIDETLGKILSAAHLQVQELHLINNPNFGEETTAEDVVDGCRRMEEIVSPYIPIDFSCVKEELYERVRERVAGELMSISRYLTYPWSGDTAGGAGSGRQET